MSDIAEAALKKVLDDEINVALLKELERLESNLEIKNSRDKKRWHNKYRKYKDIPWYKRIFAAEPLEPLCRNYVLEDDLYSRSSLSWDDYQKYIEQMSAAKLIKMTKYPAGGDVYYNYVEWGVSITNKGRQILDEAEDRGSRCDQ